MELHKLLLLSLLIPIFITSVIALLSTYLTYQTVKQLLKDASNQLLEDKIFSTKTTIAAQKAKLDTQFIKIGREIRVINNKVKLDINYEIKQTVALMGRIDLKNSQDPRVQMVKTNKILVSGWFLKDIDIDDFTLLPNNTQMNIFHQNQLEFLLRSLYFSNALSNSLYLEDNLRGFSNDGLMVSNPYKDVRLDKVIINDKFCRNSKFDARCRQWFINTKEFSNQDDNRIFITDPILFLSESKPFLSTTFCTKVMLNNALESVGCGSFRPDRFGLLSNSSIFQSGFQVLTVARSQSTILYQGIEEGYNKTLLELLFKNNSVAYDQFMESVPHNLTQYQYKSEQSKLGFIFKDRNSDEITYFGFNVNENSYICLTAPINVVDQINKDRFEIYNIFTFYTVLSTANLLSGYQDVQNNILSIQIIIFIISSILLSIFSTISYIHGVSISNKIENPIVNLTFFLQQVTISDLGDLANDSFDNLERILTLNEELETKEVKILYESFLNLFNTLKIVSQTFYNKNQSTSIIKLNQAIQHFSLRDDRFALGICHNNLGNILIKEGRYQEAMENYLQSCIQIEYELGKYQQDFQIEEFLEHSSGLNEPIIQEDYENEEENEGDGGYDDEENNFQSINQQNKVLLSQHRRNLDLTHIKFDRILNYSKAFKLYNLQKKNYLWKEYQQILEQLLSISKILNKKYQLQRISFILIELSFCFLKQNQFQKAVLYLKKVQSLVQKYNSKVNEKISLQTKMNQNTLQQVDSKQILKNKNRNTFVSEANSFSNQQSSIFHPHQSSFNILISPRLSNQQQQQQSPHQQEMYPIKLNSKLTPVIDSENLIRKKDNSLNNEEQKTINAHDHYFIPIDIIEGKIIIQEARCQMFKGKYLNAYQILLQYFEQLQTYNCEDRLICLLLMNQCFSQIVKCFEKKMTSSKYIYYQIINVERIQSQEIERTSTKKQQTKKLNFVQSIKDSQNEYIQSTYSAKSVEDQATQAQTFYISSIQQQLQKVQNKRDSWQDQQVDNTKEYLVNLKEELKVTMSIERILHSMSKSLFKSIRKFTDKYLRISCIVDLQDEIHITEVNQILQEIYNQILIEKYDMIDIIKIEKYCKQIIPLIQIKQIKSLKFPFMYQLRSMYFAKTKKITSQENILNTIYKSIWNFNSHQAKPQNFVDRTENFIILFVNVSYEQCKQLKRDIINQFSDYISVRIIIYNISIGFDFSRLNSTYLFAEPDDDSFENTNQNEHLSTQQIRNIQDNHLNTGNEESFNYLLRKNMIQFNQNQRERIGSAGKQIDQKEFFGQSIDQTTLEGRFNDIFEDFDFNFDLMNTPAGDECQQFLNRSTQNKFQQTQKQKPLNKEKGLENYCAEINTLRCIGFDDQNLEYSKSNQSLDLGAQQHNDQSFIENDQKKKLKIKIFGNQIQLVNYLRKRRESVQSLGIPLLYERLQSGCYALRFKKEGMKQIIKDGDYNAKQILHLLCYEIIFGIGWNMFWGNVFYKYQFQNLNSNYLRIWTSFMIIFSISSAFIYLTLIYSFIKYTKERNDRMFNIVTLLNQIWNCISCFINVCLILICINEYCFTEKFANHGQLSETIKYYLIIVGVILLLAALSAAALFLSCLFLSKFEAKQEEHNYQLIQEFDGVVQVNQIDELYD